jgi:hypothetical protein
MAFADSKTNEAASSRHNAERAIIDMHLSRAAGQRASVSTHSFVDLTKQQRDDALKYSAVFQNDRKNTRPAHVSELART